MESWRKVWREGVAPLLSTTGLEALKRAMETDDPRLLQGATTAPPPLQCVIDWPVEAACALTYCGVIDLGGFEVHVDPPPAAARADVCSVGDAEEYFARVCFEVDQALGEPAVCRHFLNFWDETPRQELFRLMLPEVDRELARRARNEETVKVRTVL